MPSDHRSNSAARFDADDGCPSRAAVELVASKWALHIIPLLDGGPLRNNELLRRLGLSQKMLTQTLEELERNGLVIRTDHGTVPPQVEYRLSTLGRSLSEALVVFDRWSEQHDDAPRAARRDYDARFA